jgi:hypothetical protein
MSQDDSNHKIIYSFLKAKYISGEPFSKEELTSETDLSEGSAKTYFSKLIRTFLFPTKSGMYKVGESFIKVGTWKKFKSHISQSRSANSNYKQFVHPDVIIFEFFMPLSNENYLRISLDNLFYKDTVVKRLKRTGRENVLKYFKEFQNEENDALFEKVASWISEKFIGYSISHVNGRYRADDLKNAQEIYVDNHPNLSRYIVDETTAIVKFIFPVGKAKKQKGLFDEREEFETYFTILSDAEIEAERKKTDEEAEKVRWAFYYLFVRAIIELVNGEDEIWLLESGHKNRLHRWVLDES